MVLFDLGGVLVELGSHAELAAMVGGRGESSEAAWARWLGCEVVRAFERGELEPEAFAAAMVTRHGLEETPAGFLERFAGFTRGAFPGALDLLDETRAAGVEVGCLSNTNALHWRRQLGALFEARLRHCLVSFRMGVVKPDRAIFEAALRQLQADPRDVLFLDDNPLNVDGARSAGLQAARVQGPAEAREALVASGVLD